MSKVNFLAGLNEPITGKAGFTACPVCGCIQCNNLRDCIRKPQAEGTIVRCPECGCKGIAVLKALAELDVNSFVYSADAKTEAMCEKVLSEIKQLTDNVKRSAKYGSQIFWKHGSGSSTNTRRNVLEKGREDRGRSQRTLQNVSGREWDLLNREIEETREG